MTLRVVIVLNECEQPFAVQCGFLLLYQFCFEPNQSIYLK